MPSQGHDTSVRKESRGSESPTVGYKRYVFIFWLLHTYVVNMNIYIRTDICISYICMYAYVYIYMCVYTGRPEPSSSKAYVFKGFWAQRPYYAGFLACFEP